MTTHASTVLTVLTWRCELVDSHLLFVPLFLSDENTRADLKKLPVLPTKVLKEHPSLAYW